MSMDITNKIRILETIIKIPYYMVIGYTHGRLIYYSTIEGITNIWSLDVESKVKRRLTREPISQVAEPKPDSPYVIYTRDVTKGKEHHKIYYVDSKGREEKLLIDTPSMRIFSIAFDSEKIVFTGATTKDMALYIGKWNGSWEKVQKLSTLTFVADVNDKYIVGHGTLKNNPKTLEIFIYDMETGIMKIYTPREGSVNKEPKLMGTKVLFESNFKGKNRLYIYDINEGTLSEVKYRFKDYDIFDPIEHVNYGWTKDGRIWVIGEREGRSKLFIDGKEVKTPQGFINNAVIVEDKAYVSLSSLREPHRILEVDLKTNNINVVIDNKLPKEIEERIGEVKFIRYKSFDGLEIPTFIIESYLVSKPGPTIIYVHGGPWSEVVDAWNRVIVSLVASGYHVIAPNFRGSTGYGEEFRTLDIGDPGGGDLMDIVYARKWAIENGLADKIAIMGYSYGGYMTYLALGKYPHLWSCGIAGAGIVDWEEMYVLSDAIFRKFIETLFASKRELLRERSPIAYVEKVKAPLCIIHPQNDTRTPLKPVLKYMSKLLEQGKTFEVHIIPDMGHRILTVEDALRVLLPTIMFLEKYMKP